MARQSTAEKVSSNDTPGPSFHKTRFMKPESTTSKILRLGRLTNRTHPLFRRHRFFPARFEIDYNIVKQSACLASRFLECGRLDSLLKAIILPKDFWQNPDDAQDWAVQYDTQLPAIDEEDKKAIRDVLDQLSMNIIWCVRDFPDEGAVTNQVGDEHVELPECPYGYKSIVEISAKTYDALADATAKEDLPLLLTLRFQFAVMLVHEVGHLVHNFMFGKLDREPSLRRSGVAELGFEMESRLFEVLTRMFTHVDPNGEETLQIHKHEGRTSELTGLLVLWDYPSIGLVARYRKDGAYFEAEETSNKTLDVAWRVSLTFLTHFFEDVF